ncbi:MAG TPA: hypothetical protein VG694_00705 [Candidatus Paceibacterota bacterium]|nr:hypothetical protein [Candidatus Paceibacterota bacterium]
MEIRDWDLDIEPDSHSAEMAAHWLEKNPDNAVAFFKEAENSSENFAHFETPDLGDPTVAHHFTVIYKGAHRCYLRKREGY